MDEAADKSPPSGEQVANKHQTSPEQPRTSSEQAANSPEPPANIDLVPTQSETRAKLEQYQYDAKARARRIKARAERKQAETDRRPSDLLKYARKNAPSDGEERETRCAWIVRDADAPCGEWWVAKCCGAVLDSSAKVGPHRCIRSQAPRRAARSAQPSGGARWWPF